MKGVQVNPPFEEKASRMELLVRILYLIVFYIVSGIIGGLLMLVTWPLQMLAILILGKRILILHRINRAFTAYNADYMAYLCYLTDERPKFIPEFE